jgi:hypothetical protein
MRILFPLLIAGLSLVVPDGAALADDVAADVDRSLDPGVERAELDAEEPPDGPLATFARFETAWADADVDALVELLDPQEKIRLSFTKGGPRGGYFNRDQAFFLLKDMFVFAKTDRFEFEKYWNLDSEGRSPYAVAVRGYHLNDGVPREDRVYLSLRRRGDAWWVGEIRSIDR